MYAVKEVFYTLQGEGWNAGTAAVFVRFAGCNLWSGRDKDRERDAARNGAECPRWCDTDFVDGTRCSTDDVVSMVGALVDKHDALPLIVLTGGEPLLQVDQPLVDALHAAFPRAMLAVETNGTIDAKVPLQSAHGIEWVCVSPKVPAARLRIRSGSELKVVVPAYSPTDYAEVADGFDHLYVSAEAQTLEVGRSVIVADNLTRAAVWCMEHPEWRLTLQSHKIIGVP